MKVYKLENLHCAQCAATIEETLAGLSSVHAVRLQFATLELHVDTTDLEEVKRTIDQVEPGVRVMEAAGSDSEVKVRAHWPVWAGLATATGALAGLLLAENLGFGKGWPVNVAFAGVYCLVGWPVLRTAALHLLRGHLFDENFLMSVATLAAWLVGAGAEAASVMVFYQWGEWLQDRAVEKSRRSLGALLASRPRTVRVIVGAQSFDRAPGTVPTGTEFEVRAGEQVPLDGVVLEGRGTMDTAGLTGESLPRSVEPGTEVAAGSMDLDGVWRMRSLRPFAESAWAGIVTSVDSALESKAPLERFLTRFARVYTPAVLALSLVLFGFLVLIGIPWHDSLYRSLVLLVISCPCALVVSVPLTYLGAIGAASRRGLLIRDAGALDRLARVDAVAFDKTGTLTAGRPEVKAILPAGSERELNDSLDAGFSSSSHPLAQVWGRGNAAPEGATEVHGQGVTFTRNGLKTGIGRRSFLADLGFPGIPTGEDSHTTVHAANLNGYLGRVDFEDPAKADTPAALQELRGLGLETMALLSGDSPGVVEVWGTRWGLEARGGLLPGEKLAFVDEWERNGKKVMFVGDGLNDAPVLARSTVGVSLGAGASAAAIETADVAVLDPSPRQVVRLVRLGRRTRTILYQNIALALGLKALFMVLGGLGLAGLWEAVFADVGVALLAVANSLRAAKDLGESL